MLTEVIMDLRYVLIPRLSYYYWWLYSHCVFCQVLVLQNVLKGLFWSGTRSFFVEFLQLYPFFNTTNLNWGSQPGVQYDGVSVLWHGAGPVCPAYLPSSLENIFATARHVRVDILRENRLARVQSLSKYHHILRGRLVNHTDCAWDDLWDEPVED